VDTVVTPGSGALSTDDVRLVRALQVAPRAPYAVLAAALGVTETSVRRRYLRLRADGQLRVVGVVDPGALGQTRWLVRLRCRPGSVGAIAEALARREDVSWVAVGAGGSEVSCAVRSRTAAQRDDLLGTRLPRTAAVLQLDAAALLHQFVGGRAHYWGALSGVLTPAEEDALGGSAVPFDAAAPDPVGLSEADERMLAVLARDGRAALVELAAAAGVSPGRATRRLDALLAARAVYLDVELLAASLGFAAQADLALSVHPAHLKAAGQALAAMPEVAFAAALTGPHNLHAVAHCRDLAALYELTSDRIGALPGVQSLEVSPVLRHAKQIVTRVVDGRLS
jgi:DNA-binding Lrp family transcriptional regulator